MSLDTETLRLLWALAAAGGATTEGALKSLNKNLALALAPAAAQKLVEIARSGKTVKVSLTAAGEDAIRHAGADRLLSGGAGDIQAQIAAQAARIAAAEAAHAQLSACLAQQTAQEQRLAELAAASETAVAELTQRLAKQEALVDSLAEIEKKAAELKKRQQAQDKKLKASESKRAALGAVAQTAQDHDQRLGALTPSQEAVAQQIAAMASRLDDQEQRLATLKTAVVHLTTAGGGGGAKASAWPDDPAEQDDVVCAAALSLAERHRDRRTPLWELRAALPDAPRAAVNDAIYRLGVARRLELIQTDNAHLLTADQADALIPNAHGAPTAYLAPPGAEEEGDEI